MRTIVYDRRRKQFLSVENKRILDLEERISTIESRLSRIEDMLEKIAKRLNIR